MRHRSGVDWCGDSGQVGRLQETAGRTKCAGATNRFHRIGRCGVHYRLLRLLRCCSRVLLHDHDGKLTNASLPSDKLLIVLYSLCSQYAFLMMTLIVLQIIVAVFIFLYIGDVSKAADLLLEKVFNDPSNAGNQELIDVIQRELHCCKFKGPGLSFTLDKSCCPPSDTIPCTLATAYQQGCSSAFASFIESLGKTLGYVAIGVASVQVSRNC
jgi:Tetraspanin family